jgi:hypothetical protein
MFGFDPVSGIPISGFSGEGSDLPPVVTGVDIDPDTVTLNGSAQQQFTAVVTGTGSPSQAVTWSTTAGIIDEDGLFTAPEETDEVQSITVTATSVAEPDYFAVAVVTVRSDAALRRYHKRKYIVRRKDQLFVFDNPFDAKAFEDAGKPQLVTPVKAKGPRQAPKLVKASETVSLPAVVSTAPDWAKAQMEQMIAKAQYARLLSMVAELEEEDELELILLNL